MQARGYRVDQSSRQQLLNQIGGLHVGYYESQRMGAKPADGDTRMPHIWQPGGYKKPSFDKICSTYVTGAYGVAAADAAQLQQYPGFFDAGSAHHTKFHDCSVIDKWVQRAMWRCNETGCI